MKLRFLAAAGPDHFRSELGAKLRARPGLSLIAIPVGQRLTIWADPETPSLTSKRGDAAALGLLFDRSRSRKVAWLQNAHDHCSSAVRDCWGAYVLFASDACSHRVLRDPSGSIPVYHGQAGPLHLYASDGEMLRQGWPGALRPNLDAARQWLAFPFLRTSMTGAIGVGELLPGHVHDANDREGHERQLWSPASFAAAAPALSSFEQAAALLRDEILRVVPRLADGEQAILRLSGGLDSSIVAAALAQSGAQFSGVTFATRSADGDERRFARALADHLRIALHEIGEAELGDSAIGLGLEERVDPLRRPPNPLLQPLRRAFAAVAAGGSAAGLMLDGGGGDNVFASLNSASPAVDAFLGAGLRSGVRTLRDLAALHGCTVWEAARAAGRRWRRGRGTSWPIDRTFLVPSAVDVRVSHPWLQSAEHLLPGSADHVRMIAGAHHFLTDPHPGEAATLHPLLAQPVVELCLQIPSWLWFRAGRDRAVARAAFCGLVPGAILERRGKGTLESMFLKGYTRKRAELKDFLVAGRLAEEGIVDPRALADYLDRAEQPRDPLYIRILEIASAEQWLRSFHS